MAIFDSAAQASAAAGATQLTTTHQMGYGSGGYVIVSVGSNFDPQGVTAPTYAGIPMSRLATRGASGSFQTIWGLANPPVGTNTFYAPNPGASTAVLHSFTGVVSVDVSTLATGNSSSMSVSRSGANSSDVIWAACQANYTLGAGAPAGTPVSNGYAGCYQVAQYSQANGSAPVAFSTSSPLSTQWGYYAVLLSGNPTATVFDSAASSSTTYEQTSLTWNHVMASGTGGYLLVSVGCRSGASSQFPSALTVKYGNVAMTLLGYAATGSNGASAIYGLSNPPTGTNAVTVSSTVAWGLSGISNSFLNATTVSNLSFVQGNSNTPSVTTPFSVGPNDVVWALASLTTDPVDPVSPPPTQTVFNRYYDGTYLTTQRVSGGSGSTQTFSTGQSAPNPWTYWTAKLSSGPTLHTASASLGVVAALDVSGSRNTYASASRAISAALSPSPSRTTYAQSSTNIATTLSNALSQQRTAQASTAINTMFVADARLPSVQVNFGVAVGLSATASASYRANAVLPVTSMTTVASMRTAALEAPMAITWSTNTIGALNAYLNANTSLSATLSAAGLRSTPGNGSRATTAALSASASVSRAVSSNRPIAVGLSATVGKTLYAEAPLEVTANSSVSLGLRYLVGANLVVSVAFLVNAFATVEAPPSRTIIVGEDDREIPIALDLRMIEIEPDLSPVLA